MKNPCLECNYKGGWGDGEPIEGLPCNLAEKECTDYGKYLGYQECQKELAEKYEPCPCVPCGSFDKDRGCTAYDGKWPQAGETNCFRFGKWLGQQEGHAKGLLEAESKKGEVAREIVEWLKVDAMAGNYYDFNIGQCFKRLEDYCRSKGWL